MSAQDGTDHVKARDLLRVWLAEDRAQAPAMTMHELKCWPEYFAAVLSGEKTFDVRKNDRGFVVGDVLHLREWSVDAGYTGRETIRRVSYVLSGGTCGVMDGYVVLGLHCRQHPEPERTATMSETTATAKNICSYCQKPLDHGLRLRQMASLVLSQGLNDA
jgi:hypothetical protein